jgi:hypothetical protein
MLTSSLDKDHRDCSSKADSTDQATSLRVSLLENDAGSENSAAADVSVACCCCWIGDAGAVVEADLLEPDNRADA